MKVSTGLQGIHEAFRQTDGPMLVCSPESINNGLPRRTGVPWGVMECHFANTLHPHEPRP
ncbi:MAG: hypothetical protein WCK86_01865 [Planctomycetia bacterium]